MTGRRASSRRGFTLIEVMAVVVIIAVLAAASMPVMDRMGEARMIAAADAIEHTLVYARSISMASAQPAGVSFDLVGQRVSVVVATGQPGGGFVVGSATDALGQVRVALDLDAEYPGSGIQRLVDPAGQVGSSTIWFAFNGLPEIRNDSGDYVGPATADAVITMQDATVITVPAGSGAVIR